MKYNFIYMNPERTSCMYVLKNVSYKEIEEYMNKKLISINTGRYIVEDCARLKDTEMRRLGSSDPLYNDLHDGAGVLLNTRQFLDII